MASLTQRASAFVPAGSGSGQSLLQPQRLARSGGGRGRGRGVAAPAAVAAAFAAVRRACRPGLGTEPYAALDQLDLQLDLGAAVDQLLPPPQDAGEGSGAGRAPGGEAGAAARRPLLSSLLAALPASAPQGAIRGFAQHVLPRDWARVQRLQLVVDRTDAARAWLLSVVQAQVLEVAVGDQRVGIPASAVPAGLPPDHAVLTLWGVPPECARQGLTEAVLRAAGYGSAQVVHERAGIQSGPSGERLPFPCLDVVVGVVHTPREDGTLRRLPRSFEVEGEWVELEVRTSLRPLPRITLRTPAPQAPAPQRAQHAEVLERLGEAHGLTAAVQRAGPVPIAEAAAQQALPPGSRAGLGHPSGAQRARQPAPPPALPQAPPPQDVQDAAMRDAPAAPDLASRPPGFGAALAWLEDFELSRDEACALVAAVEAHSPQTFGECAGAGRPGDLTPAFRAALHAEACSLLGAGRAAPLQPGGRSAEDCLPAALLEEVGSDAEEAVGTAGSPADSDTEMQEATPAAGPASPSAAGASPAASPQPALQPRRSPRSNAGRKPPVPAGGYIAGAASAAAAPSPPGASAGEGGGGGRRRH